MFVLKPIIQFETFVNASKLHIDISLEGLDEYHFKQWYSVLLPIIILSSNFGIVIECISLGFELKPKGR